MALEALLAKLRALIADRLDPAFTTNPFRDLDRRFVIAKSPRSGSHLLCEGLLAHGAIVDEFFNIKRIVEESDRLGLVRFEDYCRIVLSEFTVGGTFGVQGAPQILLPLIEAGELPRFAADWKFVYLRRENAVRQAISQFIAKYSGSWISFQQGGVLEDNDFDGREIAGIAKILAATDRAWEEAFTLYEVEPLRITYESLDADPAGVCASAALHVGLNGPPVAGGRILKARPQRQATDLNARWEARFRAEGWEA
ncbi:MAG: Stf0 family sulfotransferase [Caulobacteraceae bacterium]